MSEIIFLIFSFFATLHFLFVRDCIKVSERQEQSKEPHHHVSSGINPQIHIQKKYLGRQQDLDFIFMNLIKTEKPRSLEVDFWTYSEKKRVEAGRKRTETEGREYMYKLENK